MSTQPINTSSPFWNSFSNIMGVLVIIVILAAAFFIIWYLRLPVGNAVEQTTIRQPLGSATQAMVELKLGATQLQLDGEIQQNADLIGGQVETLTGIEHLKQQVQPQGKRVKYHLEAQRPAAVREPTQWPRWVLHLNPNIPIDLRVSGGMGPSELNLRRVQLSALQLNTEAGRHTVTLPEQGQIMVRLTGGLSRTEVRIPQQTAVRLQVTDQSSGNVVLDGRVIRDREIYTTPGYATAQNRIDLAATTGTSHIVISRIP